MGRAITVARILGKSRAVTLFAALVAVAVFSDKAQRRRDEQAETEDSD